MFEIKWPGDAKIYKCIKKISQNEMDALKRFECDEIEKVHLIQSDKLDTGMLIDGVPISNHHLLAARYVHKHVDWELEIPEYLKDFKLF